MSCLERSDSSLSCTFLLSWAKIILRLRKFSSLMRGVKVPYLDYEHCCYTERSRASFVISSNREARHGELVHQPATNEGEYCPHPPAIRSQRSAAWFPYLGMTLVSWGSAACADGALPVCSYAQEASTSPPLLVIARPRRSSISQMQG